MKSIFLFLLMVSGLATAQSAPVTKTAPVVSNPADAGAQKAKAIVQQSIQALGGAAYLAIKDVKQEGRGFGFDRFGASRGVGVPFVRSYAHYDRERYDFFRDGQWVIIHTGNKGYETTYHGTRAQEAEEISDYLLRKDYTLERVLKQWASDPKTAFFYEGETIAETKRVHQIALMNANNQGVTLYIDIKTLLPVKKSFTWRNTEMREMWEESDMYDNYRLVSGVQTPFLLTSTRNAKMYSQRFLKTVTYNNHFPDSLFTPPPVNFGARKK
ncbi:MAG: hypothetical protein ABIP81_06535 [Terriglobales bacterium]